MSDQEYIESTEQYEMTEEEEEEHVRWLEKRADRERRKQAALEILCEEMEPIEQEPYRKKRQKLINDIRHASGKSIEALTKLLKSLKQKPPSDKT